MHFAAVMRWQTIGVPTIAEARPRSARATASGLRCCGYAAIRSSRPVTASSRD